MQLTNLVKKVFKKRNITSLELFGDEVKKLSKKQLGPVDIEEAIDKYLFGNAINDIAMNWDKNTIVYREQLFQNTQFRISLTEEEVEAKRLYIGHRFSPFIHPEVPVESIQLQDGEGHPIAVKEAELPIHEFYRYVSLLAPYAKNTPNLISSEVGAAQYYDLNNWMKANNFEAKDALLVVPVDYENHVFRLEKLTSRELATQTFITQNKDKQLTEAIEDVLNWYPDPMPVDTCLFWAYSISKPTLVENPATPPGPFIGNHEDFTFHNFSYFTFIHYQGYEERVMEDALTGGLSNLQESGKAKDLEGIFGELGNSFSETFVVGFIVQKIHANKTVEKEEIKEVLFKKNHFFVNAQQEKNFEKALDKLIKKLQKKWAKKRLAPSLQRLLSKTLDLKITIVKGLREIDANLVDVADIDLTAMGQLTNFDSIAEQILYFMLLSEDEEQQLSPEFGTEMIPQIEQMKVNFKEGVEYILSQL